MADDTLRFTRTLYRDLVAGIRSRSSWILNEAAGDPDDVIAAVVDGDTMMGELFFTHTDTGAQISLRFPEVQRGGVAELLLDSPLDSRLEPEEDGFVGRLCSAQESIAATHETPYLDPAADTSLLARVRIPAEFDEGTLERTFDALDAIAVETNQLHERLERTLDPYLDGDSDEKRSSTREWVYICSAQLDAEKGRISVPHSAFESGPLASDSESIHWAQDRRSGLPVLATEQVTDHDIEYVDAVQLEPVEESIQPLTVPEQCLDAASEAEGQERRHFFTPRTEAGESTPVVYIVTETQLANRLGDSGGG